MGEGLFEKAIRERDQKMGWTQPTPPKPQTTKPLIQRSPQYQQPQQPTINITISSTPNVQRPPQRMYSRPRMKKTRTRQAESRPLLTAKEKEKLKKDLEYTREQARVVAQKGKKAARGIKGFLSKKFGKNKSIYK